MGPGILCQLDWVVAKERGFFADEGLDVEFLDTDYTAANTVTGVGPNGPELTDVGVVEYPALPRLASRVDNYYVVAGEHSGCRQLVVRADSPINTLEELGGARVAIDGATATAMWDYLVRTVNPETEGLRWEVGAGPEAIADLLREGRVDAAVLVDPWDEEADRGRRGSPCRQQYLDRAREELVLLHAGGEE